ncbi:MAG: UDP-N-acetylmuramoyl-L-alanyl-D-glutamate--2,6-diaminopimelate ligase [Bacilli bacterium]|nr:UDP-N-acetylmuramoyl-L-alanyl-D-glutamate--2,6-diaminopimelate ligase [Bacilli bacterium]
MIDIQTDSRKIKKGDTFVALKGISSNGDDYIEDAIKNGASKVVVEKGSYDVETIVVPDTREYLNEYLSSHYNKILGEMIIIGVTGTNGKTTDCYLINEALNKLGCKCAYIGTIGFYIDKTRICPLPNTSPDACDLYDLIIRAYDAGCKAVALEVSSHGLYLGRIKTIPFDYAGFTNLTHAHLELHGTKEEYAKAKQMLFRMLKDDGKAFINYDDEWKDTFILDGNDNYTYGFNGGDYHITNYKVSNFETEFTYTYKGETNTIKTELIGKYNVSNAMMPIMILDKMGYSKEDIRKVMSEVEPPDGRMNMIKYKTNRIIIDYAHTPDGVKNAMEAVNEAKEGMKGNLYTIFTCRGRRDRTMRPIMAKLAIEGSKIGIMTGDHQYDEDPRQIIDDAVGKLDAKNYEVIWNRRDAVRRGIDLLKDEDILLILGKGYEKYNIINGEKVPVDDIGTIEEYLKELDKITTS